MQNAFEDIPASCLTSSAEYRALPGQAGILIELFETREVQLFKGFGLHG